MGSSSSMTLKVVFTVWLPRPLTDCWLTCMQVSHASQFQEYFESQQSVEKFRLTGNWLSTDWQNFRELIVSQQSVSMTVSFRGFAASQSASQSVWQSVFDVFWQSVSKSVRLTVSFRCFIASQSASQSVIDIYFASQSAGHWDLQGSLPVNKSVSFFIFLITVSQQVSQTSHASQSKSWVTDIRLTVFEH